VKLLGPPKGACVVPGEALNASAAPGDERATGRVSGTRSFCIGSTAALPEIGGVESTGGSTSGVSAGSSESVRFSARAVRAVGPLLAGAKDLESSRCNSSESI
jgi:hypothetical protein